MKKVQLKPLVRKTERKSPLKEQLKTEPTVGDPEQS